MKIKAPILTRIALLFIGAHLIAAATVFAFSYHYMMDKAEQQSVEISRTAAVAAMTAIGSEEGLYRLYEDEAFREQVHRTFRFICRKADLRYLYLYTIEDDGLRHYIICAGNSDEDDERLQAEYGFGSVRQTPLYQAERYVLEENLDEDYELINNEYGWVCMTITPVRSSDGRILALIGADDSIQDVRHIATRNLITLQLLDLIVAALAYILALLLTRRSVVNPIVALSDRMRIFAVSRKIDNNRRKTVFTDEITDMEKSFEKLTVDINQYVSDIETLTREKLYTQTQLDVANRIQSGIVPREYALSGDRFAIYGCAQAARTVGGDFYDVFQLGDGQIGVVVGDISDKGISAALFMAMVKTSIREKLKAGHGLADTLNLVNNELCASNPGNMFATVFALTLDPETGIIRYANAGHEEPLVLGREPSYLKIRSGIALGLFEDSNITEDRLVLCGGDGILLYTDGITEAINTDRKQYGKDRLRESAAREYRENPLFCDARALVGDALSSVFAYSAGTEQFDDITCLAVTCREAEGEKSILSPELKSFAAVKNTLLSSLGESDHTKSVILACEEIFANIVSYSGADQVIFRMRRSGNTCLVTFDDNGTAFDPVSAERSDLEFEALDQGGMGIFFARRIAKDMIYSRIGDRNVLTLVFDAGTTEVSG